VHGSRDTVHGARDKEEEKPGFEFGQEQDLNESGENKRGPANGMQKNVIRSSLPPPRG
jgi:hypothetical protein